MRSKQTKQSFSTAKRTEHSLMQTPSSKMNPLSHPISEVLSIL